MSSRDEVAHSSFHGASGGAEHFISVMAPGDLGFEEQIARIEQSYENARREFGLSPESAIFRRIFVSDVINQSALVRNSALARQTPENPTAISLVQQPPLPFAKLALLAYHVEGERKLTKRRLSAHDLLVERNGRRHLWTTGLCAGEDRAGPSSFAQTRLVLGDLIVALARESASLRDNCVRTWLYIKDIDVFYRGMVDGRGEIFAEEGLTRDTHYFASTGIEGACAHRYDLVALDAYSNLDLEPAQVSYLKDLDRLCATQDYGVHFERGTKIAYDDRAHLFLSGTASIDGGGRVVHEGDVLRQLDRTLQNIEALLGAGGASLPDLKHLIVYLRDPADYARVEAALARELPGVPCVIVQAAVCRPQWLVEIEGLAIAPNDAPGLPGF